MSGPEKGDWDWGLAISRAIRRCPCRPGSSASIAGRDRATFSDRFSRVAATAPAARPAEGGGGPGRSGPAHLCRSYRILLVEDDPDGLRVLARLLGGRGHRVAGRLRGRGPRWRAGPPSTFDLVVSDIGLPDGSGPT